MKTWTTKQLKTIREWSDFPERDDILFDDCGQIVREAARQSARAGFIDIYKRHCDVTRCTPEEALAILESILAATEPEPEFLTPPQVARLLSVNPDKVRGWIDSGKLPALDTSTGKRPRWKIKPCDVDDLRRTATPPTRPTTRKTDPNEEEWF